MTVALRRGDLRVLHAVGYEFRSASARKESLIRTAFMVPSMFETGIVRAHVFPLVPVGTKRWRSVIGVEFPLPVFGKEEAPTKAEFGIVLKDRVALTYHANRTVHLRSKGAGGGGTRQVTFLDEIEVRPGDHEIIAMMYDPMTGKPTTANVRVQVPEIPKRGIFLSGPLLGRRAGPDVVFHAGAAGESDRQFIRTAGPSDEQGSSSTFEPLFLQQTERDENLVAVTHACVTRGLGRDRERLSIRRSLFQEDGTVAGSLPNVPADASLSEKLKCQALVDVLPTASMRKGGYVLEAAVEPAGKTDAEPVKVKFAILDRRESASATEAAAPSPPP